MFATGGFLSRQGYLGIGRDHGQGHDRIWTRQGGLVSRHGNGVATRHHSSFVATENSLS